MIQHFRFGKFKENAKKFDADFEASDIGLVEKNPLAYKHMFFALFMADNLGYV